MKVNTIHNIDCIEGMQGLPDDSIDLTVTSPPYDNLRKYNGYQWDFEQTAKELYRITKDGGIVVWIVSDATVKGSETGTSFKQALFFKECGFNLHDTMIWQKPNAMPQIDKSRYTQCFEYMFIFSKGKPKTVHLRAIPTKYGGKFLKGGGTNDQSINRGLGGVVRKERIDFNIFSCVVAGTNYGHPAVFPLQLAKHHIESWSNEGDTVCDPFMGSGTTAIAAIQTNRKYIGMEISKEYCEIAKKRIASACINGRKKEENQEQIEMEL